MANIVVLILYVTETCQQEVKDVRDMFYTKMNAKVKMLRDPTYLDIERSIKQIRNMPHEEVLNIVIVNYLAMTPDSINKFKTKDASIDTERDLLIPFFEGRYAKKLKLIIESGKQHKSKIGESIKEKVKEVPTKFSDPGSMIYIITLKENDDLSVRKFVLALIESQGDIPTAVAMTKDIIVNEKSTAPSEELKLQIAESMKPDKFN